MPRQIAVVPHTHWDREWYEPFEAFRLRLVGVLDRLLHLLQDDPSYSHFLLDGQMAMIDDYLEIRPEAEEQIRSLAVSGRVAVGPWYVLADEFLISAETLVRNLQLGVDRAAAFGGAMAVGYLPDMFGHVAQMPQLLAQAGMAHAVVWRGVPEAIDRTAFWWESPDGSVVRAEYLVTGYGNGAAIPDDAGALVRRARDHVTETGSFLVDGVLFMNGTDHQAPQPWLGRIVAEANEAQTELEFTVSSLPKYLSEAGSAGLPRWSGELRSGARAHLLMGVTSNRVDVKQAAAATARSLERRAEPYGALFANPDRATTQLLARAWKQVIRNAAHDSICACSVDEVVDAVLGRFADARAIADGLASQALATLAASMATAGPTAVNPAAADRFGLVETVFAGSEPPAHTQVLDEPAGAFGIPRTIDSLTLDAVTVRTILGFLPNGTRIDDNTWIQGIDVAEDATGMDVSIAVGPHERPDVDMTGVRQDLYTRLGARPEATVRIRLDQPPVFRVLARIGPVPGLGWHPVLPVPAEHPVSVRPPTDPAGSIVLTNGIVEVMPDHGTGTFAVDGIAGFGRLVDGGDFGDSYNYSPPTGDSLVDRPEHVTVAVVESGPLRAKMVMTAHYLWPTHVDPASQSRCGSQAVTVTTVVEIRADDPVVRVRTTFVNPCRDHRLRVHLPLPRAATTSTAECAFATVERPLSAEGRSEEVGLPTFPSRRFVQAGGLTVVHDGLNEYELVDIDTGPSGAGAHALALTVLRSTGMLSRLGMAYRPLPAGPLTPVPGLQMVGRSVVAHYALCLADIDPYDMADDVLTPLEVVHSVGGGTRAAKGHALAVRGAKVSALRRRLGGLELRVFNPTGSTVDVQIDEHCGWLVDLCGRTVARFDGHFELRAFGIATVHLPTDGTGNRSPSSSSTL